jgi:hypothetical protein
MALASYFDSLIKRVESSDAISNQGKDRDGFFLPTRSVLLQKLNMLRDLYDRPAAKPMLKGAWAYVVEHLPPEWLVLEKDQQDELKQLLS